MSKIIRLLVPALAAVLFSSNSHAFNAPITGGNCTFSDFSTGGIFIFYSCVDQRGRSATDLHLDIYYSDTTVSQNPILPRHKDYNFSEVQNGRTFTVNGIVGNRIWNNNELLNAGVSDPETAKVVVSGYWTPAVPEPSTYSLLISGLVVIGFAARRSKNLIRLMGLRIRTETMLVANNL